MSYNTFTTPKGTILPLQNLKGKDYMLAAHRIVWFREERPDWAIHTDPVQLTDSHAIFRCRILDHAGILVATAHKREDLKHFPDFLEKAETGSIARCLSLCGFGTQFVGLEFDEGDRLADAPLQGTQRTDTAIPANRSNSAKPSGTIITPKKNNEVDGEYRIPFGGKINGLTLKQALSLKGRDWMEKYIETLETFIRDGQAPEHHEYFKHFISEMSRFIANVEMLPFDDSATTEENHE